ncbi:MAG: lamin tail domain-containing protein, partial [Chloroflexi bacterium]|nr:lamin tail domain-containing protein [Chloroflexota bacterium]
MSKPTALFIVLVVTLSLIVSTASAADDDLVISEIMIDAVVEGSDWGEWIEIYNKGTTSVDLAGWELEDNTNTDAISAAVCPNGSCIIPASGCWLIAASQSELQQEFDTYTNPNQPAVDGDHTIFLGERPGNGLANGGDHLILRNAADMAVDCYSWDGSNTCNRLTYFGGGDGFDGALAGEQGQSVTNIQHTWYTHVSNGSPYDCNNAAVA